MSNKFSKKVASEKKAPFKRKKAFEEYKKGI